MWLTETKEEYILKRTSKNIKTSNKSIKFQLIAPIEQSNTMDITLSRFALSWQAMRKV